MTSQTTSLSSTPKKVQAKVRRRDLRLARQANRVMQAALNEERRSVLRALRRSDLKAATRAITSERWETALSTVWLAAGNAVWDDTTQNLGETGIPMDLTEFDQLLKDRAEAIAEDHRKELNGVDFDVEPEQRGVGGRLGQRVARALYRRFQSKTSRRAISEALQAAASVQHVAAKAVARITDAEIVKVWVTVGDDKVRSSHNAASGQRRPLDKKFNLSGGDLDHPRDPSGPASEVINCRCWTIHERVGGISPETGQVQVRPESKEVDFERMRQRQALVDAVQGGNHQLTEELYEKKFGAKGWGRLREPSVELKIQTAKRIQARMSKSLDADDFNVLTELGFLDNVDDAVGIRSYVRQQTNSWAATSGNSSARAIALQRSAVRELLPAEAKKSFKFLRSQSKPGTIIGDQVAAILKQEGKLQQKFLRAMYDDTQEFLAANGIESITVTRGHGVKGVSGLIDDTSDITKAAFNAQTDKIGIGFESSQLTTSPLSSWSTDRGVAESFLQDALYDEGVTGVLSTVEIPASRVCGMPGTGFGCFNEAEFVVLAAPQENAWVQVIAEAVVTQ